jgi:L-lactate dehydrogenase complex protein LldG
MGAREEILARIRAAAVPPVTPTTFAPPLPRPGTVERFAEMLSDYRASVRICDEAELAGVVGELLSESTAVALPDGWPATLTDLPRVENVHDLHALDAPGVTVLTGCALAIAETGTIVLDGGTGQGHRALSLVPDHHVCVVHSGQIVADVPDAIAAIPHPTRPLTFISGPSATSDIELNRVEGVHGPRKLDVVIVRPGQD